MEPNGPTYYGNGFVSTDNGETFVRLDIDEASVVEALLDHGGNIETDALLAEAANVAKARLMKTWNTPTRLSV